MKTHESKSKKSQSTPTVKPANPLASRPFLVQPQTEDAAPKEGLAETEAQQQNLAKLGARLTAASFANPSLTPLPQIQLKRAIDGTNKQDIQAAWQNNVIGKSTHSYVGVPQQTMKPENPGQEKESSGHLIKSSFRMEQTSPIIQRKGGLLGTFKKYNPTDTATGDSTTAEVTLDGVYLGRYDEQGEGHAEEKIAIAVRTVVNNSKVYDEEKGPKLLSIRINRAPCKGCYDKLNTLLEEYPTLWIRIKAAKITDQSGVEAYSKNKPKRLVIRYWKLAEIENKEFPNEPKKTTGKSAIEGEWNRISNWLARQEKGVYKTNKHEKEYFCSTVKGNELDERTSYWKNWLQQNIANFTKNNLERKIREKHIRGEKLSERTMRDYLKAFSLASDAESVENKNIKNYKLDVRSNERQGWSDKWSRKRNPDLQNIKQGKNLWQYLLDSRWKGWDMLDDKNQAFPQEIPMPISGATSPEKQQDKENRSDSEQQEQLNLIGGSDSLSRDSMVEEKSQNSGTSYPNIQQPQNEEQLAALSGTGISFGNSPPSVPTPKQSLNYPGQNIASGSQQFQWLSSRQNNQNSRKRSFSNQTRQAPQPEERERKKPKPEGTSSSFYQPLPEGWKSENISPYPPRLKIKGGPNKFSRIDEHWENKKELLKKQAQEERQPEKHERKKPKPEGTSSSFYQPLPEGWKSENISPYPPRLEIKGGPNKFSRIDEHWKQHKGSSHQRLRSPNKFSRIDEHWKQHKGSSHQRLRSPNKFSRIDEHWENKKELLKKQAQEERQPEKHERKKRKRTTHKK
ncbi:MAG: hypothetical protein F6J95_004615 [Leptolyngbya sp. SIO1E4]|nr:hypothetical protein [Leptolyngbya sp. SIO1E4]